jgi:hypothetical protein
MLFFVKLNVLFSRKVIFNSAASSRLQMTEILVRYSPQKRWKQKKNNGAMLLKNSPAKGGQI